MRWLTPRPGFYVAQDYFSREVARGYLTEIFKLGADAKRGFHHPDLKPNRFHATPKYPVDHFMGWGFYWDPMDYRYKTKLPVSEVKPWPVPPWLIEEVELVLRDTMPHWLESYRAEAVLVNYYTSGRKMGWHVDKDEDDHLSPVIGFNFGSPVRFYFQNKNAEEESFILPGNSVYLFGDEARLMRHAVGAPYKKPLSIGSEEFLKVGERVNLTVRKVRL